MPNVLDSLFSDTPDSTTPNPAKPKAAIDFLFTTSPIDSLFGGGATDGPAPTEAVAPKKKVKAFREDEGMLQSIFNDVGSTVGLPILAGQEAVKTGGLVADLAGKYGVKNTGKVLWATAKSALGFEPNSDELHSLASDLKQAGGDLHAGQTLLKDYQDWQDTEATPHAIRGAVGATSLLAGNVGAKAGVALGSKIISPFARKLVEHELSSIAAMATYRGLDPDKQTAEAVGQGVVEGVVGGLIPQAAEKTLGVAIPAARAVADKVLGVGGRAMSGVAGVLGGTLNKAIVAVNPAAAKRLAAFEVTRANLARNFHYAWDRLATEGQDVIRRYAPKVADGLLQHRSDAAFLAGRWTADAALATNHLSKQEQSLLSPLLEGLISPDNVNAIPEIEGKAINGPAVIDAADKLRGILQEIGQTAEGLGVLIFDPESEALHRFVMLNNYVPHRIVDTEQFLRPGNVRDKALEILMDKKKLTMTQAEDWLEKFHKRASGEIAAHVAGDSHIRASGGTKLLGRALNLPGYAEDVTTTFPDYFAKMAQRIDATKRFGEIPQGVVPTALNAAQHGIGPQDFLNPFAPVMRQATAGDIAPLPERASYEAVYPKAFEDALKIADPEERQYVVDTIKSALGWAAKEGPRAKALRRGLLDYQVITKLGLSQLGQSSQYLTGLVRSGTKGAFKDFIKSFSNDPEMLDRMTRAGITLHETIRKAEAELVGAESSLSSEFLKKTGFTYADTRARIFGALRGHTMLEHQAEELNRLATLWAKRTQLGTTNPGAQRSIQNQLAKVEQKFMELGVDPKKVIANGGVLDQQDILRAMQKVSTDVNFWGDTLSLPHFMRSPWGRVLTQFKTFGYQQAKFMNKWVVQPALRGDAQPLIRSLLILPAGGDLINTVKRTVRRKDLEPDAKKRLLEGFAAAGGFGVLSDTINGLNHGLSGGLALAAGPAITDIVSAGVDIVNAAQGETKEATKHLITGPIQYGAQAINPVVGAGAAMVLPGLANTVTEPGTTWSLTPPETKREERKKKLEARRAREKK